VTIGVGFKCIDGIVLASDTQYTRGSIKTQGPKLFPLSDTPELAVALAGAGRVPFMKRACEKIEAALKALVEPALEDVRTTIERALVDFFHYYIYPMPSPEREQSGFELIAGVWTRKDGFGLFKTEDVTVTPVTKHGSAYCSIGYGQYVSEYALGLTFQPGINMENAKFIAALCVKAAKDYVDYCGGRTQIITLGEIEGSEYHISRVNLFDIRDAEQYSEDLFETIRYIMSYLDPTSLTSEESVRGMTDLLKDGILRFRQQQVARRERLRTLRESVRNKQSEAH
jgi:20S proteasome alpha/beta subunit